MATLESLTRGVMAFHYDLDHSDVSPSACGTAFQKGHNLPELEKLASQLSEKDAKVLMYTEDDERSALLKIHPQLAPLNKYLNDFFYKGMGL